VAFLFYEYAQSELHSDTDSQNGICRTCRAHKADPTAENATVNSVQELHKRVNG